MSSSSDYLKVAVEAAQAAGCVLKQKLGKVGYREKHPADLVTEADEAAQTTVRDVLLRAFPDHRLLGEEQLGTDQLPESACGSNAPDDLPLTWIVDPLDGTTNFVHQVPFFATSIGLARGNDLICGVIYNPISDELFTATKNGGVFLNGEPIRVRPTRKLSDSLFSISFPTRTTMTSPDYLVFLAMMGKCQAVRRTGSTALNLAYLAAGRFDLFSGLTSHAWDVAAGVLMVEEAGGVVSNERGEAFDLASPAVVAAATPELHRETIAALYAD